MLLSGALEGMHGAEALAVLEILQQAQRDHGDGSQNENIGMFKTGQRAEQSDEYAGGGDHGETKRVDLAAMHELGELFAVEYLGHGNESLLAFRENQSV